MGWFGISKSEVKEACREAIRDSNTLKLYVTDLKSLLNKVITNQTTIMATQAELAAELAAKTVQIRKAIDEITTRLAALEAAVKNSPATPELTSAVAALGVAVQAADDIIPDAPQA